jgi:hypothetical protein
MAEKVTLNPKTFSRTYGKNPFAFYPFVEAQKKGNVISPVDDGGKFKISLEATIPEDLFQALSNKGIPVTKRINSQGKEQPYVVLAEIVDNELQFTKALDEIDSEVAELVQKDAPNITSEAKGSFDQYVNDQGLTTGASTEPIIPNQAASGPSSTPVANGLGQRVTYKKTKPKKVLVYPINMSDQQDCMEFSIFTYKNRKLGTETVTLNQFESTGGGNINEKGFEPVDQPTVFLPVTKISDTNSVNWQEDQLNEFQRYAASVSLQSMGAGSANFGESVSNFLQSTLSGISNFTNFAKRSDAFGNYVRTMLAGQAVQSNSLVTRATGSVVNPNMELLFNGPLLRQFQFSFDLIAKSQGEADEIKKIIRFFKRNMAVRESNVKISDTGDVETIGEGDSVEAITAKIGGNNVFLSSPHLFRLRYLTSPADGARQVHQSIGQIKMCALQNFTVDYTPMGSFMTFNDPERSMFMYRLSMSFKELTPLYDTDYVSTHPIGF